MAISQTVYTLGTALQEIVAPSVDTQRVTLRNLQPQFIGSEYSRRGYAFQFTQKFTISALGTATFVMATAPSGAQLVDYDIVTDDGTVNAYLIEGATITASGTPYPAFNLDRNSDRVPASTFDTATTLTGGTVIASEFAPAGQFTTGGAVSEHVYTLRGSEDYGMQFVNTSNQSTNVYFSLRFVEQYNGLQDAWLGTSDASYRLGAGQEIQLQMYAGEAITALTLGTAVKVAVIRQD